jgi:hypothetical protein
LRQQEGEDNSIIQEFIPEHTSYQTRGQSNYTLFLEKRKQAEREWGTVEACYFMYKYERNIWRAQQPIGSSISDTAYRKATGLPQYSQKELGAWKNALSITSLGMTLFCDTRQAPYNIWTIEEKIAWVDWDRAQTEWTEKEERAIAERWNGKPPGEADWKRASMRAASYKTKGTLTQREKDILEDNIHVAEERKKAEGRAALEEAHKNIAQVPLDDELLELDWHDEDNLQIDAKYATEEALEFWRARHGSKLAGGSKLVGKRGASGPSPSKASGSRPALRAVKKSKKGKNGV